MDPRTQAALMGWWRAIACGAAPVHVHLFACARVSAPSACLSEVRFNQDYEQKRRQPSGPTEQVCKSKGLPLHEGKAASRTAATDTNQKKEKEGGGKGKGKGKGEKKKEREEDNKADVAWSLACLGGCLQRLSFLVWLLLAPFVLCPAPLTQSSFSTQSSLQSALVPINEAKGKTQATS